MDAGLTPMQAIQSATQVPAQMIHVDYKLGTLQPGKLADLLILDADPLADIRNIEKIDKVVKNGSVVDTSYHRDYQPAFSELEGVGISSSTAGVPKISEVTTVTLNQNSQALRGGSPFELVVKGQTFRSSSLVFLNGRPLKHVSLALANCMPMCPPIALWSGTFPVIVFTPWPGGGNSNVSTLTLGVMTGLWSNFGARSVRISDLCSHLLSVKACQHGTQYGQPECTRRWSDEITISVARCTSGGRVHVVGSAKTLEFSAQRLRKKFQAPK